MEFLFRGKRGVVQPILIGLSIMIFMALVGFDFPESFTISSITSILVFSGNTTRALWEDMAILRVIMRYGRDRAMFISWMLVFAVGLITNFVLLLMAFIVFNFWEYRYVVVILVWTFSSTLMANFVSIMGEVAKVGMEFFTSILILPAVIGLYGYLKGEDPLTFLGIVVVMGIFYLSLSILLSDTMLTL